MAVVSDFAFARAGALVLAFAAGLALGALFFGGLWLTVRSLSVRQSPFLFITSFLVRSAVLLGGLWWFGAGDLVMLAACGLGVLVVRYVFVRMLRVARRPTRHVAEVG